MNTNTCFEMAMIILNAFKTGLSYHQHNSDVKKQRSLINTITLYDWFSGFHTAIHHVHCIDLMTDV